MLQISEIRTVAADDLWLSPAYERDIAGPALHLGRRRGRRARRWWPRSRQRLAPFGARPHWGKVFTMPPATVQSLYPRLAEFAALRRELDPDDVFGNAMVDEYLVAALQVYSTEWLNTAGRDGAPMEVATLTATFAALGDPVRQRMVELLADGDATVSELAARFPISVQAVSKHIKVLEHAGVVSRGKAAQTRPVHLEAARWPAPWTGSRRTDGVSRRGTSGWTQLLDERKATT